MKYLSSETINNTKHSTYREIKGTKCQSIYRKGEDKAGKPIIESQLTNLTSLIQPNQLNPT